MDGVISFRRKRWVVSRSGDDAQIAALQRALACPDLLARLLVARGITDPAEAAAFLNPEFKKMHSPGLLPNLHAAVDRIAKAVAEKQKIIVYGDYDVDGITGTTMLWHTLREAGANVEYYIPHRLDEGYGLNSDAVAGLIDKGAQLLITIDCGVSAMAPITLARQRGVDVIVTDHHEIPPELPPACAIVHPRLPGSQYPNPDLCGAGVAFKVAWALAVRFCGSERVSAKYRQMLVEFAALVGLGTLADVVPLVGENRIIARYGLMQLPRSENPGLQALIAAAGYANKTIDGIAVGFGLAPRLNAAGRMGHAHLAVEMLTTAGPERAAEIADYLEDQNRDRQATERKIVESAKKQIDAMGAVPPVIVLAAEGWHAGVVGIVASRIVDAHHRPTFILASDGETLHGSARSINGFALHEAIEHCRDLLISGGGHAMAGGVKLRSDNLAEFRSRICAFADGLLTDEILMPTLPVDACVRLTDITPEAVARLADLEPHGRCNPHPRFLLAGCKIIAPPRRVGATGAHLQLPIAHVGFSSRAIAFRMGELQPQLKVGMEVDLVVEPKLEEYNGSMTVGLHVADIARADGELLGK